MVPEDAALQIQASWRGWRCRRRLAVCRERFAGRCAALDPQSALSWPRHGLCTPLFLQPAEQEPAPESCQTEQLSEAAQTPTPPPACSAERRSRLLSELAWSQAALADRLLQLRSQSKAPEA